jgi:general stress protein YciG
MKAKNGGENNMARGDSMGSKMSVEDAGRKGGEATAKSHDRSFYQEIGRKGGEATSKSHDRGFYQDIGRKGGEARANDEDVRSGKLGRMGGEARSRQRGSR